MPDDELARIAAVAAASAASGVAGAAHDKVEDHGKYSLKVCAAERLEGRCCVTVSVQGVEGHNERVAAAPEASSSADAASSEATAIVAASRRGGLVHHLRRWSLEVWELSLRTMLNTWRCGITGAVACACGLARIAHAVPRTETRFSFCCTLRQPALSLCSWRLYSEICPWCVAMGAPRADATEMMIKFNSCVCRTGPAFRTAWGSCSLRRRSL